MTEEDKEPLKKIRRKPFGHREARELISELYLFGHEEDRDVTESTKTLALFDFFTLTDVSWVLTLTHFLCHHLRNQLSFDTALFFHIYEGNKCFGR
jgi:hypothetical protein